MTQDPPYNLLARIRGMATIPGPGEDPRTQNAPTPDGLSEAQILSKILDELRIQRGDDVPSDQTVRLTHTLTAATAADGSYTFRPIKPVEYVFVPEQPVACTVRIGEVWGHLIGTLATTRAMVIRWPRIEAVTLSWTGGAAGQVIEVTLSTRPIDMNTFSV